MAQGTNIFRFVKLEEIQIDPSINARQQNAKGSYDKGTGGKYAGASTIASLRNSIKREGLQNPVLLREMDAKEQVDSGFKYQLLAGFRRMEAIGGIKTLHEAIPANVMESGTTFADALAGGMVENLQRMNLSPAEQAIGLTELREAITEEDGKCSYELLAKRVGLSKAYVNNLVKLRLNLCPEVWDAFIGGHEKATVRLLCDDIATIDDPIMQLERWLVLSGQKPSKDGASGEGGDGEGNDGDGGGEKPPKPPTRKQMLEAVEFLKGHKKHAGARIKENTYYTAAIQWLEWSAGKREKSPLSIKIWEDNGAE